jgi:ABC-type multidrug transport system permease subunit
MFAKVRNYIQERKAKIVLAGSSILASGAAVLSSVPTVYADATTDSLNETFVMLGSLLDGFVTLVPSIIHFVVAMIPLMIIGALVAAIVAIIAILPKYMKVPGRK